MRRIVLFALIVLATVSSAGAQSPVCKVPFTIALGCFKQQDMAEIVSPLHKEGAELGAEAAELAAEVLVKKFDSWDCVPVIYLPGDREASSIESGVRKIYAHVYVGFSFYTAKLLYCADIRNPKRLMYIANTRLR